jgi:hypothetical protein
LAGVTVVVVVGVAVAVVVGVTVGIVVVVSVVVMVEVGVEVTVGIVVVLKIGRGEEMNYIDYGEDLERMECLNYDLSNKLSEVTERYADNEASNKAVELALDDVDYKGSYADGIEYLKQRITTLEQERVADGLQIAALCDHAEEHASVIRKFKAENAELRRVIAESQQQRPHSFHTENHAGGGRSFVLYTSPPIKEGE